MHKRTAATFVLASIALMVAADRHSLATIASAQSLPGPSAAAPPPMAPDGLRITLLGSGGGPPVNLRQFGPSTLVEAGGKRLLFDCGRGATIRLTQAGIPIGSIGRLFLTHLHSDHVMQIPDLLLAGWVGATGRKAPLEVWGPDGTREMMSAMEKTFAFDIHVRRDVDERLPAAGIGVLSHDINEGVVLDDGVKVTAFLVDHGPVKPAFGYRVDYRGRSVALSGDTRVSENLVKFATGVDVLIHEAVDAVAQRAASANPAMTERIIAHHTTGEQAGEVFARVKPRLAVYSHAPDSDALIKQSRQHYAGPLQRAEDLLVIDIGEQINVRRIAH
jgi:ribonuclease Z